MWAWVGVVRMQVNGMFFLFSFVLFSLEPHARMNPAKGEDDTKNGSVRSKEAPMDEIEREGAVRACL